MSNRAVVLGGGGVVGAAWECGLAAAWGRSGVDLADADLILGTSSGAVVGALIALRHDLDQQVDRYRAAHVRALSAPRPSLAGFDRAQQRLVDETLARTQRAGRDDIEAYAVLRELTLGPGHTSEEDQLHRLRYLAGESWPQNYACTAFDVDDACFALLRADWPGTLQLGLAAAVSVPGIHRPIWAASRRYADGGCFSATHADLVSNHERILIVRTTELPQHEQKALAGVNLVMDVVLDWAEAPFGNGDAMNSGAVMDALEIGLAQGLATASAIAEFWGS